MKKFQVIERSDNKSKTSWQLLNNISNKSRPNAAIHQIFHDNETITNTRDM